MIKTMQAAVLAQQGKPLIFDEVELPPELTPGQVLVKVSFTSVCGSQVAQVDGTRGDDPYLPHLLGHEGSGVVEEVGPGVRYVRVGQRVVLHCGVGRGIESETPRYRWHGAKLNAGKVTTFNEYAIVSENRLTPLPDNFPMEWAPLLGCAALTGLGAVKKAQIEPGMSVVVIGAGGVGLNLIQGAALYSAEPIIAIDVSQRKVQLALSMGASYGMKHTGKAGIESVKAMLNGELADVVIDSSGQTEMLELAYELTKTAGLTMQLSGPKQGVNVSINPGPLHFGRTVKGYQVLTDSLPHQEIPRYIKLVNAGKLNFEKVITESAPFQELNEVMERMRKSEVLGRCLIHVGGSL